MNRYPLWKYLMLVAVVTLGSLYALPNLFGEQPAVQIQQGGSTGMAANTVSRVENILDAEGIEHEGADIADGKLLVKLVSVNSQLQAADLLKQELGGDFIVAQTLAPKTPAWLQAINARPMALGLDLRGGVHFLLEVDMEVVFEKTYKRFSKDIPRLLRDSSIRYTRAYRDGDRIKITFPNEESLDAGAEKLRNEFRRELQVNVSGSEQRLVEVVIREEEIKRIRDLAIDQNLTTLRNRVNQIGVAEPLVQRQGLDRIVVELPGIQDPAEAKRILGKTATLEYRLVAKEHDPSEAARTGVAPPGTELFYERNTGNPILLEEWVIAEGDQLVSASAGQDEYGSPAVIVSLDGAAAKKMRETTVKNIGDPMAVLFIENKYETRVVEGEEKRIRKVVRDVISVANIREAFGPRFQTTGLTSNEAHDISVLLRAGALSAPVDIVEERTVGPSLGADNIKQGRTAVMVGFLLVIVLMAIYYRVFGLFADMALLVNLVLIVAMLSILQATLTLPGIAGIVLTVGMAVDANVLIFERIREELDAGNSPQSAISAGYDKAFTSIADANVTTLIAAVVLFALGTGPVQGFAVTPMIGILTSMFTAIVGTRALANLVFGSKRKLQSLPV